MFRYTVIVEKHNDLGSVEYVWEGKYTTGLNKQSVVNEIVDNISHEKYFCIDDVGGVIFGDDGFISVEVVDVEEVPKD